jgi:hypothetical protein
VVDRFKVWSLRSPPHDNRCSYRVIPGVVMVSEGKVKVYLVALKADVTLQCRHYEGSGTYQVSVGLFLPGTLVDSIPDSGREFSYEATHHPGCE